MKDQKSSDQLKKNSPFLLLNFTTVGKFLELPKLSKKLSLKGYAAIYNPEKVQRQSFTKYFRLTLVFMSSSALQEKINFYF